MSYITKTYLETQFKNFAEKIKSLLNNKVDKVEGKGLSTNDLTSKLKSNYDIAYDHSQKTSGNPHGVTKDDVGLGNVDNTADTSKNVKSSKKIQTYKQGSTTETYGDNYNIYAQWRDSTHVKMKCDNFTVETDYATSSGTAKTISDTLPMSKGGTGQTSGINAANALINSLDTDSGTPTDEDYYISQSVGGGTTTTTYHRRPMRSLLNYIKPQLATVATSGSYNDLSNKPTIPTVGNGTVTIKQSGESKGTFTMNQSGNTTIELTDNNTVYTHPTSDGSKHVPANGTSNGGKYLKATTTAGTYEWGSLTKSDVTDALGYTPYTPSKVDAELNSIHGDIFYLGVSTKKFTYTVYNQDTLKDWIENKSGNDYTSVLIKKGTHSYTITDINNFISVSKQGTLYIEGEEGSKLSIKYEADKNLNYFFIIGCENNSKLDMFPENASIDYVSTHGYKRMSLNNVNIYLYTFAHKNSGEYYIGILKYANGINNCNFKVDLAYGCKQTTACCYYGCTNLNNCKGITVADYNETTVTTKTGHDRLRPFYSCSRVINSYAYGRNGYAGGAFYNGDHIINCNAKFENMYYGETFYNVSHVIGCRSYASVGTENGGSACAYKKCKKMLYNYASAGSYSESYASDDTNSTYLCANTLNGGWNS